MSSIGNFRFSGRMHGSNDRVLVSRLGSPRDEQLLPDQVELQSGPTLLHVHYGASSFRPMSHDTQLERQSNSIKPITGTTERVLAEFEVNIKNI